MEVITHRGAGKLQQIIEIGAHRLVSDAPVESGGEASGPGPHDLLAAALGACTALTVTMYAQRKEFALDDVVVSVKHSQEGAAYVFHRHIRFVGTLTVEQAARLTDIANKCPVHKTLTGQMQIITEVEA